MQVKLFRSSIVVLALFATATAAQAACGDKGQTISIVGASTLDRLSQAWTDAWECSANSHVVIESESGGSSAGIARACGTFKGSPPADIAGMTRLPFKSEAQADDGWNYDCERSTRNLIGIEVAVEGVSAIVSRRNNVSETSASMDCLYQLETLSLDQLRWIFSSFTENELIEDGWNPASVPNADGDPTTHLWSELNPACEATEIIIAGPPVDSGSALLFDELVFGTSTTETFDVERPGSFFSGVDNAELVDFLTSNDAAIGFFDIGFIFTTLDVEKLALVSLNVDGEIFKATVDALESGEYPMSRLLYYSLYNDRASLEITRNLVEFIFSEDGDLVTKDNGYWPLPESKKMIMTTRIQSKSGIPKSTIESYCGPPGGTISIAGSSTVKPIAELWSEIYSTFCDVEITVEGGGSSNGAGRVCGDEERGMPVDIGDMSREWQDSEATSYKGFVYECLEGDVTRSAIQVDVAIDGLTVAVAHSGHAYECIQILGGLTTDQLRWIYSSYSDQELEDSGWDPQSVPNNDGDSLTHRWSELNEGCADIEIRIAGPDDASGTYEYFLETIMIDHDNGETFDILRPGFSYFNSEDDGLLVDYIFTYSEAISYFGYNYFYENQEALSSVPIRNSTGVFVAPTPETIGDGTYNPLARRIYMNLLNDAEVLQRTVPFLKFGLKHPEVVVATGYVAVPEDKVDRMVAVRLESAPHSSSEETGGLSGGAIAGIVVGSLVFVCAVVVFMRAKQPADPEKPL